MSKIIIGSASQINLRKALESHREKEITIPNPGVQQNFKVSDPRLKSMTILASDGTPMTVYYIPMPIPKENKK